ncbi:hypothetical protein D3C83_334920 [compost metagenome]
MLTPRFEVTSRDTLFTNLSPGSVFGRDHDIDRRTGDFIMRARNVGGVTEGDPARE